MELSRRRFLAGAVAGSATAFIPFDLLVRAASASAASGARFLRPQEYTTADAICSRIVPGDQDPGAHEARAVDFIDLFLAAFELPSTAADNPAIYLHGRYSGRNPYPDTSTGRPSPQYPAGDFVDPATGRRRFLPLSRLQQLSWRAQLYGARVIVDDATLPTAYRDAVAGGLIPLPPPLRDTYRKGLVAFDSYAKQLFGAPSFDRATPEQQDVMLNAAANPLLGNVHTPLVGPPPDAAALFPIIELHTFQGCFGLPEYGGNGGDPARPLMWAWLVWEGDTQPLGNSVYDENLTDADIAAMNAASGGYQGTNTGFGDGVHQPKGGYREHREVSTNARPAGGDLGSSDVAPLLAAMQRAGRLGGAPRR